MASKTEEFQIKKLSFDDISFLRKLITLFHEVFEMKTRVFPSDKYLLDLLAKPGFLVFTVIHKDEVIGGLTAYELPGYYSKTSEILIYDLAIKAEFQRKRFGQKLISALKEYSRKNEVFEIFVAANKEDKHALKFYQATGGIPEKVIHFTYR